MSNLNKQVAAIKQQLAVEAAATVARFSKVENDLGQRIQALEQGVHQGFQEMRQAVEAQSMIQQAAIDRLLDLRSREP